MPPGRNHDRPAGQGWRPSAGLLAALTLGYACVIAYGSLVPLQYQALTLDEAYARFASIQDLELGVTNRADWLANLLLYVPLGTLATLLACRLSRWLIVRLLLTACVAALAIAFAVGVEFAQLWFPPRTVSQNDLRAEAIGVSAGALIGLVLTVWGPALARIAGLAGGSLASNWGFYYVACLLAYSVLPGDLVMSSAEFWSQLDSGKLNLVPFSDLEGGIVPLLKRCLQVACFAPIGYLGAQRRGRRRAPRVGARDGTRGGAWGAARDRGRGRVRDGDIHGSAAASGLLAREHGHGSGPRGDRRGGGGRPLPAARRSGPPPAVVRPRGPGRPVRPLLAARGGGLRHRRVRGDAGPVPPVGQPGAAPRAVGPTLERPFRGALRRDRVQRVDEHPGEGRRVRRARRPAADGGRRRPHAGGGYAPAPWSGRE